MYRRYLQLEPRHVEEFIAYLRTKGVWGEAAARLAGILNDDTFRWAWVCHASMLAAVSLSMFHTLQGF